jgi:hypothetical protein
MANGTGLPSGRLSRLGKLRRGERDASPSALYSEELDMPAGLAQQEDANLSGSPLRSVAQTRKLVLVWRVYGFLLG